MTGGRGGHPARPIQVGLVSGGALLAVGVALFLNLSSTAGGAIAVGPSDVPAGTRLVAGLGFWAALTFLATMAQARTPAGGAVSVDMAALPSFAHRGGAPFPPRTLLLPRGERAEDEVTRVRHL